MRIRSLLLGLGCCAAWTGANAAAPEKVRLTDVQTITLFEDGQTTGRRSRPVPQLECRGKGCGGAGAGRPPAVQCYNRGSDGADVQWECRANMPDGYSFGKTQVICEGYAYPDDPYILRGSCQLQYELRVAPGAAAAAAAASGSSAPPRGSGRAQPHGRGGGAAAAAHGGEKAEGVSFVRFTLLCLVGWLLLKLLTHRAPAPAAARSGFEGGGATSSAQGWGGGGGGGGSGGGGGGGGGGAGGAGGGWSNFRRRFGGGGPRGGGGEGSGGTGFMGTGFNIPGMPPPRAAAPDPTSCGPQPRASAAGSGPGFWSGLAAGSGLGYMFRGGSGTGTGGGVYSRRPPAGFRPPAAGAGQQRSPPSRSRSRSSSGGGLHAETSFASTGRR